MVEFRKLPLEGAYEIIPRKFGDDRGFFSETYNQSQFRENGIDIDFVQDNQSFSAQKGVLRGLHCQTDPFAQDKLVRVTKGRVLDVLVDIREGSATYKQWCGVEISAEKWNQVLVPKGFLHGFLTLEENTEVIYKVSALYSSNCDRSIRYDDPSIGIEWPLPASEIQLSEKDKNAPLLENSDVKFTVGEA